MLGEKIVQRKELFDPTYYALSLSSKLKRLVLNTRVTSILVCMGNKTARKSLGCASGFMLGVYLVFIWCLFAIQTAISVTIVYLKWMLLSCIKLIKDVTFMYKTYNGCYFHV